MNYWLVKSEPETYSWDKMVSEGEAILDGVRNYAARNFLRQMKIDEPVFFYHSIHGKEIVGIAKVTKEFFPDPTDDTDIWSSVKIKPVKKLANTVTLEAMKKNAKLKEIKLIKIGRLSVMPITPIEYKEILKLAGEKC
jgi:predicted RNA-binding protein with PUA-like domain